MIHSMEMLSMTKYRNNNQSLYRLTSGSTSGMFSIVNLIVIVFCFRSTIEFLLV